MSLRLGFDLDGVFADLGAELRASDLKPFDSESTSDHPATVGEETPTQEAAGLPAPAERPFETPHLKGAGPEVWNRVRATENFWESLDEIEPGAVAYLAELARKRKWEVIFLTSRPTTAGDAVQVQSQRWLERHGFPLPSVFVTKGSRGRIASALTLDLVVDDNPENCLDVVMESAARAILVWRGGADVVPASARRLGIGSVSSVHECLRLLEEADQAKRGGGGLLSVLRRLLGLKGAVVGNR